MTDNERALLMLVAGAIAYPEDGDELKKVIKKLIDLVRGEMKESENKKSTIFDMGASFYDIMLHLPKNLLDEAEYELKKAGLDNVEWS